MIDDPREMLQRLEVAADAGGLPHDVARWLKIGLKRHREGVGLETALGLTGVRSFDNVQRVRSRNNWLIEAAKFTSTDADAPPWKRAGRLSEVVRRFQRRGWPHTAKNGDRLTECLLNAMESHPGDVSKFPESQRQLYRIIR
jgi:hypothetical protein